MYPASFSITVVTLSVITHRQAISRQTSNNLTFKMPVIFCLLARLTAQFIDYKVYK